MLEWLKSAYAFALQVTETIPPEWRVGLTGIFACLLLTQWAKRHLPASWHAKERSLAAELIGFAIGAGVVLLYDPTDDRLLHAAMVGMAGPLVYRVAIAVLVRRWPDVVDALSQDT